jgi:hypothetical protein
MFAVTTFEFRPSGGSWRPTHHDCGTGFLLQEIEIRFWKDERTLRSGKLMAKGDVSCRNIKDCAISSSDTAIVKGILGLIVSQHYTFIYKIAIRSLVSLCKQQLKLQRPEGVFLISGFGA